MTIQFAYEWANSIAISAINTVNTLQALTIRKLKALASKINKEFGLVLTKAKFGKVYSNMKKQELIDAIWFVRSLQMSCPKNSSWELTRLSKRVFSFNNEETGEPWVVYVGFQDKAKALIFHRDMQLVNYCQLAALSEGDRLLKYGYSYEVKLWGLRGDILIKMLDKDNQTTSTPLASTVPTSASCLNRVNAVVEGVSQQFSTNTNSNSNPSNFVVVQDSLGWVGATCSVIKESGNDHVWAEMDTAKGHGNVRFHKTQLEPVEEVTVETMQKMYQAAVGSRAAVAILEFIKRRGCEIVDGLVIRKQELVEVK